MVRNGICVLDDTVLVTEMTTSVLRPLLESLVLSPRGWMTMDFLPCLLPLQPRLSSVRLAVLRETEVLLAFATDVYIGRCRT